jgi:hypothetical protein
VEHWSFLGTFVSHKHVSQAMHTWMDLDWSIRMAAAVEFGRGIVQAWDTGAFALGGHGIHA